MNIEAENTYSDPLIHKILESRYRIDAEVGRGGMGVVYRGTDLSLSRPVAIKTILHRHANDEALERFIKEARTLAQIEDPRLVPVYAVGQDEGYHYLVMKFLEGETLSERMKHDGALPAKVVRDLIRQVCEALHTLHLKGLIHRDIKPANLMIAPDGQVTVMDLGIVKEIGEENTSASITMGTPRYMPPEAIDNRALDARADLYSLGVIAFQALTGVPPFDGPTQMSILYKQAHEAPLLVRSIIPNTPKNLESAVEISLQKRPDDRFQSAMEMSEAFSSNAQFTRDSSWRQTAIQALIFLALGGATWSGFQWWKTQPEKTQHEMTQPITQQLFIKSPKSNQRSPKNDQGRRSSQEPPPQPIAPVNTKRNIPAETKKVDVVSKPSPTVRVKVASIPKGAIVYKGKRRVGLTPLVLTKKRGISESYTLKMKGFKKRQLTVKDQNIKVKLRSIFGGL
jgi:serine/threonine protein kinase